MTFPIPHVPSRRSGFSAWLGAAPGPIVLLAALNMADEFDRIAFATLSPEIRDHFGLSDGEVLMMSVVPGIVILLTAGLIGWLSDRYSRISVSVLAAVAWGAASIFTGIVPTVWLLVIVRVLSGIGRAANEIVHPSLIADLYPEPTHPRAYLVHRLGNPLAQVAGVAAGFIASQLNWQAAFFILAAPTVLLTLGLSRLKDPGRRRSDSTGAKIGMGRAIVQLASIKSFPRFWGAAVFLGAASFGIFGLASLYFEKQFDVGKIGRGFVQFLIGSGWFLGVLVGGSLANRATLSGKYRPLVGLCAGSFLLVAIGAALLVVVPALISAYVLVTMLAFGNGVWQAPYFSAVAKVAPPRLSGQAFGTSATAYAIGGFLTIAIAIVADSNTRAAFGLVGLFGLFAAVCAWLVSFTIESDIELSGSTG